MTQVFHIAKIVFAVCFIIAGTVCIFIREPLALPLFVGGIAWTQIPE